MPESAALPSILLDTSPLITLCTAIVESQPIMNMLLPYLGAIYVAESVAYEGRRAKSRDAQIIKKLIR